MAFDITIRDTYGDPLNVSTSEVDGYGRKVWLDATVDGQETSIELDRKGARRLRKSLKRFLRESKGADD